MAFTRRSLGFLLFVVATAGAGYAASAQSPGAQIDIVSTSGPSKTLDVAVGASAKVRIQKNGGTGYRWEPAGPAKSLDVKSAEDSEPVSTDAGSRPMAGAPVFDVFTVTPKAPGDTQLKFVLKRGKSPPAKRVSVKVHATP